MQHWLELHRWVTSQGFGLKEIAGIDNEFAGRWLASSVDLAIATGEVDGDDVTQFEASAALLPVSQETIATQRNRLIRAKWFLDLQHGYLPLVPTSFPLTTGEVCYLDAPVALHTFADQSRSITSRLILTNHRLVLGAREMPLIAVRRAVPYRDAVVLEPFTEGYFVPYDPQWVIALINATLQVARGELTAKGNRRPIPQPVGAVAAAATALEEGDRVDDAALVRSLADRWGHLSPELQVRAERAAEAIRGTYAVLQHLPPDARTRNGDDGFTPAQNAEVSIDNAMRALSGILLSEYEQHADQLEALRHYTSQWSDSGDLTL